MKNTRKRGSGAQRDSKPLGQLPASAQTDSQVSPPDKPPVAVANDGSVLSGKALTAELQANLPTDSAATVKRFQTELERRKKLEEFFQEYPEDKKGFEEPFGKSKRALNYNRPYDISLVGISGTGKSALTNLLLGRALSISRDGDPVTGTLMRFRHSVFPEESEKAVVSYRDRDNLFSLIQREFGRFGLTPLKSASDVKAGLVDTLDKLQLPEDANESARDTFPSIRKTIVGIVQLYFEQEEAIAGSEFTRTFPVSDGKQVQALDNHLSKFSDVIKEVNYYLEPQSEGTSLKLPTNVCLVDLPGEQGKGAHQFVIDDSLPDAGAVVFLTKSPRVGTEGERNLAERVRQCLNVPGGSDSSDKVFLVLNANEGESLEELEEGLKPIIAELFPKKVKPHFHISLKPGEEEGVPELIEELKTFTSKTLIGGRIADGQSAIDSIVGELKRRHEADLTAVRPPAKVDEAEKGRLAREELKKREQTAKDDLGQFRKNLLDEEEDFKTRLKAAGDSICQEIDEQIREAAKRTWEPSVSQDRETGEPIGTVPLRDVATAAGVAVWDALSESEPKPFESFAEILTERYQEEFNASVRQELIKSCDFHSLVPEKFLTEENFLEISGDMRKHLVEFSKRVGVAFTTGEYAFSPKGAYSDEASSDSGSDEEVQSALTDYFNDSPGGSAPSQDRPTAEALIDALPTPDTSKEEANFDEFVSLARKRYQDAVLEDTVEAFFNVFKYELYLAEKCLVVLLGKSMHRLASECRTNSALSEAILGEHDPNKQEKIAELEAKIQRLEKIN